MKGFQAPLFKQKKILTLTKILCGEKSEAKTTWALSKNPSSGLCTTQKH